MLLFIKQKENKKEEPKLYIVAASPRINQWAELDINASSSTSPKKMHLGPREFGTYKMKIPNRNLQEKDEIQQQTIASNIMEKKYRPLMLLFDK